MNQHLRILLIIFLSFPSVLFAQSLPFVMDMVHNNPGEAPFTTKYNDPDYLKSQGFNAAVVQWYVQTALCYDGVKKYLIPKKSEERKWIELKRNKIKEQLQKFEDANLAIYAFTDFLVFPKSIWEKYGKEISLQKQKTTDNEVIDTWYKKPDIQQPMTQKLLIAQIDELFSTFPELDGIVLRFGETYLQDTPFHLGGSPISNDDKQSIEDQILLINILRNEICVKRNKKLFYRTWDFGYRFHNNPDYYLAVTNAVETHPNLFFSIKYQQGDFHRMTPFNPSIGIGKHLQIIESQSRMEAYGKGAHPYYTGSGVIDGWPETKYELDLWPNAFTGKIADPSKPRGLKDILDKNLLAGVMTWSHGGGWQGPYIKHEIWTDLNTYVVSQWAQNTSLSEEEIFDKFSENIGLKGYNADIFRQIALLSIEGVRKGQLNSYATNAVWWARDEFFCAGYNNDILKTIIAKNLQQKILDEKAEATAIWLQIEALSKQLAMNDKETLSAIQTSCTYGRIKYQLIEQMWILMIEDASKNYTDKINKVALEEALLRYDELWNEWRTLEKTAPYCATIYTDLAFRNEKKGSIGELVEKLRKQISE